MNGNELLQRGGGMISGGVRLAWRLTSNTAGLMARAANIRPASKPKPDMDDVTLARKVESEIFRPADAPKNAVDINVADGVVWLRGEVKHPDEVRSLEEQVRSIPEVRGVENLLHLPKTPAPTRADTPGRQQRTRSSTKRPTPARRTGGRVTDDRTDAIEREGEPSPAEHAAGRRGRTPAPLGSREQASNKPG